MIQSIGKTLKKLLEAVFRISLLLAFFLTGMSCATNVRDGYIDSGLEDISQEFEEIHTVDVRTHVSVVAFKSLKYPIAGICHPGLYIPESCAANRESNFCSKKPLVKSQVYIDPVLWKKMSINRRKWLLFHELGHCIGKLDHVDTLDKGYCPEIMNSKVPFEWQVERCKGKLKKRLF